jgi:ATP-dependent Zn protease
MKAAEITLTARIGASSDWAAPRKRPAKRRTHTAHHEASHAVIGRVLTLYCDGATIKPNYVLREAGYAITYDPWAYLYEWEIRGKVRENPDAVWLARIITYMAGVEGEMALLGSTNCGDGNDRYQIEMMAEELTNCKDWNKLEPRLRAMTRMLVRRHRALIERAANALLRKTTLSGAQLDKLIGRSVDDVKVNAPMLLEMHRASACTNL